MIILPKLVINVLWWPLYILALFSKWVSKLATELRYNIHKLKTKSVFMEDMRFCNDKESFNFPFTRCVKFICKDEDSTEVKLSDVEFHNLRNIGIKKGETVSLTEINKYCNLPSNIKTICCTLFPWEMTTSGKNEITVEEDTTALEDLFSAT